jgi:hypothetical protein
MPSLLFVFARSMNFTSHARVRSSPTTLLHSERREPVARVTLEREFLGVSRGALISLRPLKPTKANGSPEGTDVIPCLEIHVG